MKNKITLLTLVLISLFTTAKAQINWDIKGFSGIDVSGNIELLLQQASTEAVEVYPANMEVQDLDIYVDGNGILKIQALKSLVFDRRPIRIKVSYNQLHSVKAIAGAEVTAKNPIVSESLWIKAGSGAQIELTIDANELEAKATEGGELELKGKVNSQYAFAATGGEYDGLDLKCLHTEARATTGGEVMVIAEENLTATANTGGSIEYYGDAKIQRMQTGLSGKVRKLKNRGIRVEWN